MRGRLRRLDRVVDESLLDRLINASHQVIKNGPSYRPNKRPKNSAEKPSKAL
ncbi:MULTISPECIES: hypothetical protein [unclassified Streptomyces]|uniref:hypothetical protein n=1 Tax=unclassified Streptomyces TaxID=2593676 RepID=UPI000B01CCED|nr:MULTISPECIES: hypothetical protein [unclassified Streptomyces]